MRMLMLFFAFLLLPAPHDPAALALKEPAPAATEQKKTPEEIRAEFLQKIEDAKRLSGGEKIEPQEGLKMPEIPQAIKDDKLSPAEKVQLSNTELKRAEGKITQTEADMEKDTLAREANLKY